MNANYSENNTILDDSSLEPSSRKEPRRHNSSVLGQNENSGSLYGNRKNKKDDKIPYTPEVSAMKTFKNKQKLV